MKKGFTLIELLAVIVILAIIGLITVPIISNVIEESKKQALEASIRGIVEATDYFAISNDGVYEFIFDENNKGITLKGDSLDYTGNIDAEGKLILDREGNISLCLMNDNYYAYKNYNSGIIVGKRSEDSCNVGYDTLTNKYIAFLESVGSASNVYSKDEVDNLIDNINTYILNNTNEITNVKSSIETLQTNLSNYALKSELDETNTYLNNVSQIVSSNTNNINQLKNSVKRDAIYDTVTTINTELKTITLKQSKYNYDYLELYFADNNNYVTTVIFNPNIKSNNIFETYKYAGLSVIVRRPWKANELDNEFDLQTVSGTIDLRYIIGVKILYN